MLAFVYVGIYERLIWTSEDFYRHVCQVFDKSFKRGLNREAYDSSLMLVKAQMEVDRNVDGVCLQL